MRTDFFADIAKKQCETCETCEIEEIPGENNSLNSRTVSQSERETNVRNVRRTDSAKVLLANLTNLTFQRETNVRSCETKKANSDSNLASVSHISHFSHQKTDNFASSHADEFFAGAERKAAEANRQAMPVVAGVADQFRKVFGADQMKVVYAEENGRKLGTPPAGIKPVLTGDKVPMPPKDQQEEVLNGVDCRTCLRYGPRDRYCGHKLRFMHEGEGIICAGRGYSPKGEPWKELLTEQQP